MTRDEAKKLLPIIKAFADGEDVQCTQQEWKAWHDAPSPTFDTSCQWRIKPKPREVWVVYHGSDDGLTHGAISASFELKSQADHWAAGSSKFSMAKFREVIDE